MGELLEVGPARSENMSKSSCDFRSSMDEDFVWILFRSSLNMSMKLDWTFGSVVPIGLSLLWSILLVSLLDLSRLLVL